jgi:PhoH-like ATPase
MKNKYVLDTSALITDPQCYNSFAGSDVIIPMMVLNELDKLKQGMNDASRNARVCIRLLDQLLDQGNLLDGIDLGNDSKLYFNNSSDSFMKQEIVSLGDPNYGDTHILACATEIALKNPESKVVLVSNDINLRVRAKSRGLLAEGFEKGNKKINELYAGVQYVEDVMAGEELLEYSNLDPSSYDLDLNPNEFVIFQDKNKNVISSGKKVGSKVRLIKNHSPWGVNAKNTEQQLALDLLMDKNLDLVSLVGLAGSGKSLLAIAAAMELVLNRKQYDKIIILKPIEPVSNDIGYLPGNLEEKLLPWYQSFYDSFEHLLCSRRDEKNKNFDWRKDIEMFIKRGQLDMSCIAHIRGRSLPRSIIIIDEVQNIRQGEVKNLVSRIGSESRCFLLGDLYQIDAKNLNMLDNGLNHVVSNFKELDFTGHVTLKQCERSRLADAAANLL